MNTRVAGYLTARLLREAARDLVHIAVDRGVLEERELAIDGRDIRVYRQGANARSKPHAAILHDLRKASGLSSRSSPEPETELQFDAGTTFRVVDDGLIARHPASDVAFGEMESQSQEDRTQAVRLVGLIRKAAMPPKAAEVATMLMIANALETDGELSRLQCVLQLPQPIISVRASVDGFAGIFADLLGRGLILPGKVALSDGYRSYLDALPDVAETRWHSVHFQMDARKDKLEDASVYRKASKSLPLLFVGEGAFATPRLLECAADIELDCGCLTEDIVRETMRLVLGKPPSASAVFPDVAKLGLQDLALGIRPGMEAAQALATLHRLADYANRNAEQDTYAEDEKDRASARGSASGKSGSGKKSSGNEVIQPAPIEGKSVFVPTLDTIAGFDAARDWALSLKEDLHLWRTQDLAWDDMSTKLLLSGPPGTGKTTFARALCNSLRVPLVATSVATWLEPGYLGDCVRRMSQAFDEARQLAPSILFVDEFDGIGSRGRSRRYDDYWTTIINRLLELLDGASKSTGVIVVAATNNPSVIDPALLRSGRLEKHIAVPTPDVAALTDIIRFHLGRDLANVLETAPGSGNRAPVEGASTARRKPVAGAAPIVAGHDREIM